MKGLVYTGFGVMYALVSFFGLGPVLFADGTVSERILTLVVVLLIYVLLTLGLLLVRRRLS
ncbi:hypothetical protein [Paenibacillus sp. DMB5]|uniref:DUF6954 family protein n=1 Tax=Paenibacillus sp. DMB5 TaxID=1780103 RepID=UPI00076C458F|nr:hypothetical protein [Paenibacillus sp. DMB5]KUP23462.1 hypothetical protein AWJ19_32230 [Paenibacillus sp. DMB5]